MKNSAIKYRKIRGINRRKRAIEQWGDNRKSLNINLLTQEKRDYVKFRVQPWSRLSLGNSVYPEPTGDCEYLLIKNLQKIYQSWQDSLEALQTPYYLQIWLRENYVSRSQIVCAIDEIEDFYDDTFELVGEQPKNGIRSSSHYNSNTAEYLDAFEWKLYRCVQVYDLADPWDAEYVESLDSQQLLGKQIIGQIEYQIVEIDKVWLICT